MGATTSEPSRGLVQDAWMYVWHAVLEEGRFMRLAHAWRTQPLDGIIEQLLQRGAAINGLYKQCSP
jgi:hypothetical protein